MACLDMRGLRKRFGSTIALDGVDLSVDEGEVLALIGENGAGKSTLMKILAGAQPPDEGTITLFGRPYAPRNPQDGRHAGIGMIYQELSLAPHLRVEENIMLGMEPVKGPLVNRRLRRKRAAEALGKLQAGHIPLDRIVYELPPAHQQMVEIARSVAAGCRVLIFDEPTSSLTLEDARKLFDLIRDLRRQGHAIIYISHFLEEVKELSDRFQVLRDGRSAGGGVTGETSVNEMAAMMVGRDLEDMYARGAHQPGDVLLDISSLAGAQPLKRADLSLRRGEVIGIAGLVGAGRTELLRAVMGLDEIRGGTVRIQSWTGPASVTERWAQGVGMVSENRKEEGLAVNLSIAENVTMSRLEGRGRLGWISPHALEQRALRQVETLGIKAASVRAPVQSLSGGNQQKVALARLLHHEADILLLDEPTRGIDVGSKSDIYRLIDRLAAGDVAAGIKPRGILMVSSYLPELLGACDRIGVMCRGELGSLRPVREWDEHAIMLEATGVEGRTT